MEKEKQMDMCLKMGLIRNEEIKEYDILFSIASMSKDLDYGFEVKNQAFKAMHDIRLMVGRRILSLYFNIDREFDDTEQE